MAKIIHNDTVDVLLERVSIRAFKDEAIGLDVLNTIEQAAQNTASSQYLNDWSAIRIKDPAVKTEIARICNQDYIANAPVLYIFVLDQYRNSLIAQSEGVAVDSDEFTLKNSYRFSQAQNDAVLALHAMETAAESFELGTVILGSILGNIPETGGGGGGGSSCSHCRSTHTLCSASRSASRTSTPTRSRVCRAISSSSTIRTTPSRTGFWTAFANTTAKCRAYYDTRGKDLSERAYSDMTTKKATSTAALEMGFEHARAQGFDLEK